jgi:hypothetical protein
MVESKIARVRNFGNTRESCNTGQWFRENPARVPWGSACEQCAIPLDRTKRGYVVGNQMLCRECCEHHQGHDPPPRFSPLPGPRPWRTTREAPRQSERRSARSGVLLP